MWRRGRLRNALSRLLVFIQRPNRLAALWNAKGNKKDSYKSVGSMPEFTVYSARQRLNSSFRATAPNGATGLLVGSVT
jgi:hypothetical protein